MKTVAKLVMAFTIAGMVPAMADTTCLQSTRIRETKFVNPRTLLFKMNDGSVYRNALLTPCPGLAFHGFEYVVRADEVCGNAQSIRVIESGEVCLLGSFTKEVPAHS